MRIGCGRRPDPYFLSGVLSAALLSALLLFRGRGERVDPGDSAVVPDSVIQRLMDGEIAYSLGDPSARLTLVEFVDYACPACRSAHDILQSSALQEMIERGELRLVVVPFLTGTHLASVVAGIVVSCSAHRGGAWWPVHAQLLLTQDQWMDTYPPESLLVALATEAGADSSELRSCVRERGPEYVRKLRAERQDLVGYGVRYVPFWLLQGREVPPDSVFHLLRAARVPAARRRGLR